MTDEATTESRNWPLIAGWLGLGGAVLVGIGEYTIQFNTTGDYTAPGYEYFIGISAERLYAGHYLSILAAPLYILGYWHLSQHLKPASERAARAFFLIGAYSFAVGAVWLGQRAFLAYVVQESAAGSYSGDLLETFASLNEPLVNVLRLAVLINSVIWIALIWKGRTQYPRWMAIFNPFALLALIFVFYFVSPDAGRYLLPGAMNVVHVIVFGLSLGFVRESAP